MSDKTLLVRLDLENPSGTIYYPGDPDSETIEVFGKKRQKMHVATLFSVIIGSESKNKKLFNSYNDALDLIENAWGKSESEQKELLKSRRSK